jgi:hypothetical protein
MSMDWESQTLREKLDSCRRLALEFPDGPTAEFLRDLEADIREQIRQKNQTGLI